jgi:8-oxo-dGTP pyrophosphatase MutT (NUDIX family)
MTREMLLEELDAYQAADAHEDEMRRRLHDFVTAHPDCFERSLSIGHVTGSAFIVDLGRTHTLLHHHGKLDKWLQLGGHADGEADVLGVALREAREESGLDEFWPITSAIFDVDIHPIPARRAEAEHFHYDIRYLLEADRSQPLVVTAESKAVEWVPLDAVERLTQEESMLRMVRKATARFGK